mmetsp:Transcript_30862/g.50228  ORF Transcript_30862/g.50228 Transcript_30862/m.50228 type:complete len:242 (-) Transcript_30862:162-887(-)|eukprot:jgi/Bigna1/89547/estExt_fgenesh1_pg.C_510087
MAPSGQPRSQSRVRRRPAPSDHQRRDQARASISVSRLLKRGKGGYDYKKAKEKRYFANKRQMRHAERQKKAFSKHYQEHQSELEANLMALQEREDVFKAGENQQETSSKQARTNISGNGEDDTYRDEEEKKNIRQNDDKGKYVEPRRGMNGGRNPGKARKYKRHGGKKGVALKEAHVQYKNRNAQRKRAKEEILHKQRLRKRKQEVRRAEVRRMTKRTKKGQPIMTHVLGNILTKLKKSSS